MKKPQGESDTDHNINSLRFDNDNDKSTSQKPFSLLETKDSQNNKNQDVHRDTARFAKFSRQESSRLLETEKAGNVRDDSPEGPGFNIPEREPNQ